jgi:hypothetical protein
MDRLRTAKSLQLSLELRDIVPEHDNIVRFAIEVADMIAQQQLPVDSCFQAPRR